jgi:hypothetical protein
MVKLETVQAARVTESGVIAEQRTVTLIGPFDTVAIDCGEFRCGQHGPIFQIDDDGRWYPTKPLLNHYDTWVNVPDYGHPGYRSITIADPVAAIAAGSKLRA